MKEVNEEQYQFRFEHTFHIEELFLAQNVLTMNLNLEFRSIKVITTYLNNTNTNGREINDENEINRT